MAEDILTWDGVEFRTRDVAEAEQLAAEDKVQIYDPYLGWGGEGLKYRSQFTGYHNKAMATKVDDKPPPVRKKRVVRRTRKPADETT